MRVSNSLVPDQADILSGLIWVQTVWKGYQLTTKFVSRKKRVNYRHVHPPIMLLITYLKRYRYNTVICSFGFSN